ncbi:MAG: murein biosynthesis integral membrane protein MurJ [Chloroflexi bacterium]|nr:murein biosynthesis integral membrane protein MurJ [Chloroflexota bacterium]
MTHLARSSIIIAVFFGIDKVLGFVRTIIVNRQFGLSDLDVFNVANNIPDLLSALISGGALGVALIPVLSEYLEHKGRPALWDLFSRIINLAFMVTASIAVLIAITAPWLVENVISPGFTAEQKALTVELMRLDLAAILIFSISGLAMAGLQANQHFFLPAMAPGLYNIGQIIGALILARDSSLTIGPISLPALGFGMHGLVYGVILGAALHLGIQMPGLLRHGYKWQPMINLRHPGVRQVLILLGPRVLTMFFIQLFFTVRDNLASGLGEGAVTALNLGWFIMQVPETLLGTAIAIAILPTLSEFFTRGELETFRKTINRALRVILALTIPSAALLAVGIRPLVTAAFPNYLPHEVEMIVGASRMYLLGLTGHAFLEIAARSYYAQKNAVIPLFAAAINAAGYIALAIFLSNQWGSNGIALANSIAFTAEALLLLWLLNRAYPGLLKISNTLRRVLIATSASAVGFYLLLKFLPFSASLVSIGGSLLGLGVVIPFIWPELRLLIRLGTTKDESSELAVD